MQKPNTVVTDYRDSSRWAVPPPLPRFTQSCLEGRGVLQGEATCHNPIFVNVLSTTSWERRRSKALHALMRELLATVWLERSMGLRQAKQGLLSLLLSVGLLRMDHPR